MRLRTVYITMRRQNKDGIIIINFIGRKGGGAVDAYETTKALIKLKQRVIPVLSDKIENKKLWEELGCEKIIFLEAYDGIVSFVRKSLFFFESSKKIKKELRGIRVKAVYVPMVGPWTGKINRMFPDTKQIISCHDPFPHSGKDRLIYKACWHMYDSADIVIARSKKFVPYLEKRFKDVRYLPLGPQNMYRQLNSSQPVISYPDDKINFLFFGRIDQYKGIDILLKAYAAAEQKYCGQTALTIAGNGSLRKYYKYMKKLKNICIVNRWIKDDEIASVFAGKNLVTVCPYKDATQSGVVLSSYNFGVPVIAADTGALGEQVLHGKTGLLIEKNNAKALADAMGKFVCAPEMIKEMKTCIADYLLEISWDKNAEKLIHMMDGSCRYGKRSL